jgi:hypothetical protein
VPVAAAMLSPAGNGPAFDAGDVERIAHRRK